MIVVTGASGFIGSCLISALNQQGYSDVVAVDEFETASKFQNLEGKRISHRVHRNDFHTWLEANHPLVQFVFHLGARTDTTEFDQSIFDRLNLNYSKQVWNQCCEYGLPLVYASSAATYGAGEHGYSDDHELVPQLKPLNPYGASKNEFDKWALQQAKQPYSWAGLKFFNVYGPNEYHKGRMASVIFHAFNQIRETGKVRLFKSHNPRFEDGKQLRDFIYVKDVVAVCLWLMHNRKHQAIFNLGTGTARSFLDLTLATYRALGLEPAIEFIDMPMDIREKYQYFTEADMSKLKSIGYNQPFHSLEEGVHDYVSQFLVSHSYL
jgi:ADP-L-glycero-D-manno-heptose 6-epimerase